MGSLTIDQCTNDTACTFFKDFESHRLNEDAWQLARNLNTSIKQTEDILQRYADYKNNTKDLERCLTIYENFISAQENSQVLEETLSKVDFSLPADIINYGSSLAEFQNKIADSIRTIASFTHSSLSSESLRDENLIGPLKELLQFIGKF
jgi:hypothetical protein